MLAWLGKTNFWIPKVLFNIFSLNNALFMLGSENYFFRVLQAWLTMPINWNKCPNAKSAHIHQSWAWLNLKLFNLVFIFLAHSYTPAISCALIVFRSCPGTSVDFLTFENMNATEIVLTCWNQVILRVGHKRFSSQSLVVCHPNLLPTNQPSP